MVVGSGGGAFWGSGAIREMKLALEANGSPSMVDKEDSEFDGAVRMELRDAVASGLGKCADLLRAPCPRPPWLVPGSVPPRNLS